MNDQLILTDLFDNEIGYMRKDEAHRLGRLHRAFSVFIFNSKGELLMQQRALSKYHSPGLWTNTCCSHPRDGETLEEATSRRLMEEMGMCCEMHEVYTFIYKAPVGQGLEFDHVFIGQSDDLPCINTDEVASWKYMNLEHLSKDINLYPEQYTEWFKITFEEMSHHADLLRKI